MKRICVLQADNRVNLDYLLLSKSVNQKMSNILDYDYQFIEIDTNKDTHPATKKINILHNFLHNCQYQIVIFLDSDAWIQNPNYIRDIINRLNTDETKHGCFSRDPYTSSYTFINSGSFILKVNDFTKNMYNELLKNIQNNRTFHNQWPYDQYYISEYVVLNRHKFDIYKTDILNTPYGIALRHNWYKNKDMYRDMNELLERDIMLTYENFDYQKFIDDTPIIEEYDNFKDKREFIINGLKNIIIHCKSILEGNCFYHHQTLNIYPELFYKQMNLFWLGKKADKRICEIGFNAGHSTMLLLLGRDITPIDFTIFDIGHHDYTKPCLSYIKTQFAHVNFEYVEGDSTVVIPQWIDKNRNILGKYDLIHVDGGQSEHCISNDMKNADILVKKDGYIIIDDTDMQHINQYVDIYLSTGQYSEIKYCETKGCTHRIIQKMG